MKHIFLFSSLLACLLILFAFRSDTVRVTLAEEEAWMTPTGVVIPLAFSANWENYIAVEGKKYSTRFCTLPDGRPGVYCINAKPDDCSHAFDCILCGNCIN